MAYEHRGIALKGLHEAIGAFSRENSDAVLAASLLLSWQATEWYVSIARAKEYNTNEICRRGWTQLMHGTSSVWSMNTPEVFEQITNVTLGH